jgi:peptidoglycan/LPS O-acetylase OafA/YrhL
MGVPIFFVLSGFLISYPFFKGRETHPRFWYHPGYAQRRIGKILPPFYLSIVLFLVFYWMQFHDPSYLTSAWEWATGVADFVQIPVPFNLSYWSLIVESHFYILLPLLFWLVRGLSSQSATVILFLILLAVPLAARQLIWPNDLTAMPDYPSPLAKQLQMELARFPCQLDYFAWGVLFAGFYVKLRPIRDRLQALSLLGYSGGILLAVALVMWGVWVQQFDIRAHPTRWSVEVSHLFPALAAFLLLFFVFDAQCWGSRILALAPLRFIGIVSYEWFLFHGPVVQLFYTHTGPSNGSIMVYATRTFLPLAITFGFSVLVYRFFSLPILNRIRDHASHAKA